MIEATRKKEKPALSPLEKDLKVTSLRSKKWFGLMKKILLLIEVPVNLQNNLVYDKGKNSDILDENLLSLTKRCPKKSWYPLRFHGMV